MPLFGCLLDVVMFPASSLRHRGTCRNGRPFSFSHFFSEGERILPATSPALRTFRKSANIGSVNRVLFPCKPLPSAAPYQLTAQNHPLLNSDLAKFGGGRRFGDGKPILSHTLKVEDYGLLHVFPRLLFGFSGGHATGDVGREHRVTGFRFFKDNQIRQNFLFHIFLSNPAWLRTLFNVPWAMSAPG